MSTSGRSESALAAFHPETKKWFTESVGMPTAVQTESWPHIAAGEHVLITAPTGSGKTLTAFLWALDRLLTGAWRPGRVRVLYVSPLRALNTDIRRNLAEPLAGLEARFEAAGLQPPAVRALTRSGDTPQTVRRRMLREPPEILITTPESLNILLTSKSGAGLLEHLDTVILDEIHAVAGSKRGTHLITAVERLVPLAGEFQRIALSATVQPLTTVASFVGGYRVERVAGATRFDPRPVAVIEAPSEKAYEVEVRFPAAAVAAEEESSEELERKAGASDPADDTFWRVLIEDCKARIRGNRSTLLFANSRRMTEKVTRLINEGETRELAYSHHGSLARELRAVVEKRLKDGELAAIVSTSSLELGIDIGALDEVLMVQTPATASSAIQRIGRAGHAVGACSRGVFYPTHGRDLIHAAVTARCVLDQHIEPVTPMEAPLDVLAQVMLSMTCHATWKVDDLFDAVRASYPYRRLHRSAFDLVIEMLAGRYADSRIRELKPRLLVDPVAGTVQARSHVPRLLYMAGGTIPDRGYYGLRLIDSMTKIGELDEEFVWERTVGDSFTLGAQTWQIRKITHNDVLVSPRGGGAAMAPFWRADRQDRDAFLADRVARFLARADQQLEDPAFHRALLDDYCLDTQARDALLDALRGQRAATGELPHRHHLLIERVDGGGPEAPDTVILHTFWGGTVNRPYALALAAAWLERFETPLETMHDDDCIMLRLPHPCDRDTLLSLVDVEAVERLLRLRLQTTGFFGATFRMAASTALLLPRAGFRHRTPLWLSRQRAKKLLQHVSSHDDFPLVVETWRACLRDAFDLTTLKARLEALADDEIRVREVRTSQPSPFAAGLVWQVTDEAMYDDDRPESADGVGVRGDLFQELIAGPHARPALPASLIARFEEKIQRLAVGYAPRPGDELALWLEERVFVELSEWAALVAAVARDHEVDEATVTASIDTRAMHVTLPGADRQVIALDSMVARLALARAVTTADLAPRTLLDGDRPVDDAAHEALSSLGTLLASKGTATDSHDEAPPATASLLAEWLRHHGPVAPARIAACFGWDRDECARRLGDLVEQQLVLLDTVSAEATEVEACDLENLERMLRWLRFERRVQVAARPATELPLFLAHHQGLAASGDDLDALQARLEQLIGYPASPATWEQDLLPARLTPFYPAWLDTLLQSATMRWIGCGPNRLTFGWPEDNALFQPPSPHEDASEPTDGVAGDTPDDAFTLFPDPHARYDLHALAAARGIEVADLVPRLWTLAWRGLVSNDAFHVVRDGIAHRFEAAPGTSAGRETAARGRSGTASGRLRRWSHGRASAVRVVGNWLPLPPATPAVDLLDEAARVQERIRLLLERYGIVFRALLARELPALRWSAVFRGLRLMELGGEVLSGYFFEGISGPQFMSHAAFRSLRRGLAVDPVFWLNAADPASPCGLDVEGLAGSLPARRPSTRLVYHGTELVLVAEAQGRRLTINVPPDHPVLQRYFEPLRILLTRSFAPRSVIQVTTINDEAASDSPYATALAVSFRVTREPGVLKLWTRYERASTPGSDAHNPAGPSG